MGHNGCDGSQVSGPWAIGSGYRFTMFSPPVHAGRMDQWTIYDMGVMHIGPHGSHTTWAKRSNLR